MAGAQPRVEKRAGRLTPRVPRGAAGVRLPRPGVRGLRDLLLLPPGQADPAQPLRHPGGVRQPAPGVRGLRAVDRRARRRGVPLQPLDHHPVRAVHRAGGRDPRACCWPSWPTARCGASSSSRPCSPPRWPRSVAVASVIFFALVNPEVGYFRNISWLVVAQHPGPRHRAAGGVGELHLAEPGPHVHHRAGRAPVDPRGAPRGGHAGRLRSPVRRFRKVTLPLLGPILLFLAVVLVIFAFQAFGQIDILTKGGPQGATETLVYRIFTIQFDDVNTAAVMSIGLFALTFVVTLAAVRHPGTAGSPMATELAAPALRTAASHRLVPGHDRAVGGGAVPGVDDHRSGAVASHPLPAGGPARLPGGIQWGVFRDAWTEGSLDRAFMVSLGVTAVITGGAARHLGAGRLLLRLPALPAQEACCSRSRWPPCCCPSR